MLLTPPPRCNVTQLSSVQTNQKQLRLYQTPQLRKAALTQFQNTRRDCVWGHFKASAVRVRSNALSYLIPTLLTLCCPCRADLPHTADVQIHACACAPTCTLP